MTLFLRTGLKTPTSTRRNRSAAEIDCLKAVRRAGKASQYQLYLLTKELLKQKFDEWSVAASR